MTDRLDTFLQHLGILTFLVRNFNINVLSFPILTLLAVFTVRKHSFISSDSLQVPLKPYRDFDLTWSETYVYLNCI